MMGGWVVFVPHSTDPCQFLSHSVDCLIFVVDRHALTTYAGLHWFTFNDGVRLVCLCLCFCTRSAPSQLLGETTADQILIFDCPRSGVLNLWSRKIWSSLSLNEGESYCWYVFMGSRSQWARLDPQSRSFSFTTLTTTRLCRLELMKIALVRDLERNLDC